MQCRAECENLIGDDSRLLPCLHVKAHPTDRRLLEGKLFIFTTHFASVNQLVLLHIFPTVCRMMRASPHFCNTSPPQQSGAGGSDGDGNTRGLRGKLFCKWQTEENSSSFTPALSTAPPELSVCMHAENKNGNTICLVIIFNNECVANLTDFGKRENEATVKLT